MITVATVATVRIVRIVRIVVLVARHVMSTVLGPHVVPLERGRHVMARVRHLIGVITTMAVARRSPRRLFMVGVLVVTGMDAVAVRGPHVIAAVPVVHTRHVMAGMRIRDGGL